MCGRKPFMDEFQLVWKRALSNETFARAQRLKGMNLELWNTRTTAPPNCLVKINSGSVFMLNTNSLRGNAILSLNFKVLANGTLMCTLCLKSPWDHGVSHFQKGTSGGTFCGHYAHQCRLQSKLLPHYIKVWTILRVEWHLGWAFLICDHVLHHVQHQVSLKWQKMAALWFLEIQMSMICDTWIVLSLFLCHILGEVMYMSHVWGSFKSTSLLSSLCVLRLFQQETHPRARQKQETQSR